MNASMKLLVPLALCYLVAHVATVTLEEALGQETQQQEQHEQQEQQEQTQAQAQVSDACLRAGFAVEVRACSSCALPYRMPDHSAAKATHAPSIHPLQFACRSDIDKATAFFGGSPSSKSQMQAYLADAVSRRCVYLVGCEMRIFTRPTVFPFCRPELICDSLSLCRAAAAPPPRSSTRPRATARSPC
jgi:hypothetical protein